MEWPGRGIEAPRNVLLTWKRLSPGDISTLLAALKSLEAHIGTMEGSANFVMWTNLERLGWARRVRLPIPAPGASDAPAFFVLTATGRDRLPAFLDHYDLRPGA